MKTSKGKSRFEKVAPNPSQLLQSMRDVGYSLETALADIIDNSISAGASSVEILSETHKEPPIIGVLDDGRGMTSAELVEAMRPGTGGPLTIRAAEDLGRFGLGLKTASFSQCRRLTVVTAREGVLSAATWDLDVVMERQEWVIERPPNPRAVMWADRLGSNGTLVLWEKLDRLPSSAQGGDADDVVEAIDRAVAHLGLVFHRFLAGEKGLRKLKISINGNSVKPAEPFLRTHDATQPMPKEEIRYAGRTLVIQGYTIPHPSKLARKKLDEAAGLEGFTKNQGFYVYRSGRLIRFGTWFGLARHREVTKLARIQIDIPNDLDAEWKIDVRKSSASPPPAVRKALRKLLERMGNPSRRAVTKRSVQRASPDLHPLWHISQDRERTWVEVSTEHPLLRKFENRLPDDLKPDFRMVLRLLAVGLPIQQLHALIADAPESSVAPTDIEKILSQAARGLWEQLRAANISQGDTVERILATAPFSLYPETVKPMLRRFSEEE